MKKESKEFKKYATKHKGISSLNLHRYEQAFNNLNPIGMTPNIIEERELNGIALDVFSRLMLDRIIFLGMPIDDMVANVINAQLLFLESVDGSRDVTIYGNSGGGSVYAGLGIIDVMNYIKPDISVVNTGLCASMAAVILCSGTKGKRYSLRHARTMIHQPMTGIEPGTQASDIEIVNKQIQLLKKELYEIISEQTGKTIEEVTIASDRDNWMTSHEAKTFGLIDKILIKRK